MRSRVKKAAETASASSRRNPAFAAVAKRFQSFRPAREVLTRVRAVPTIFPQFDHATGVGGLPIERFMLVHGPSGDGKTSLALGFMRSFLARGHMALFVDAERTTPMSWVEQMLGDQAHNPFFYADRPATYEDTVERVRSFLTLMTEAREEGELPEGTSAIIVVDSLRKLVPAGIFKKILKEEGGVDGMGGRAAQIKAAMNAAWLDELVPMLEQTQSAFLAITRETDDPNANRFSSEDFKVGGGKAIYYDSSLVMRVERASFVGEKYEEGSKKRPKVYGERHRITIRKTKVSGREDRQTVCYFHTSNGVLVPAGFDRARDVLELAETFGVVQQKGAWLHCKPGHKWNGRHQAVKYLTEQHQVLSNLEVAVREQFKDAKPLEITDDGEVLDD